MLSQNILFGLVSFTLSALRSGGYPRRKMLRYALLPLQYRPDLILLDVIMASKEGPDVAIEIKGDPRLKETPIIFLTATVTQQEVDEEGGKIGGQAFVAKPSSLDILLDSIEKNMIPA